MMWRILRRLRNPGIYAGVLLTALFVTLAYQSRPSYDIKIGSPTDQPLLSGFNTREVVAGDEPVPFRWTTGAATVTFKEVGRQDFSVMMLINGWRPDDQPPAHLRISSGGVTFFDGAPARESTEYRFVVPRDAVSDGTLILELNTNPFVPTGDPNPRPLGVSVQRVQVAPGPNPDRFIEAPFGILLSLVETSAVFGLFLALTGWGIGVTALGGSVPGLLGGWVVVTDRLWLTSQEWYAVWLQATLLGVLLALSVGTVGRWLMEHGGARWSATHGRALLALVLIAFVVRLSGQMHPQICIIDLNFHLHRFQTVEAGQLLFTINSAEWGGRETFYLPTAYLFMMPLYWIFNDPLFVIRLFTVAIGTLGTVPVYYLASRALRDNRAGVIAASLYLTLPMAVLPYSWGITTNLFGEFFALCSLAIVVGAGRGLRPNRPAFWLLAGTLLLALLSHPGVVQLVLLAFALIAASWLVGRRAWHDRVGAAWAFGAFVIAAGIAYVIYYRHFVGDMLTTLAEIRKERASRTPQPGEGIGVRVGGSVADKSLGLVVRYAQSLSDWFLGGLRGFWQEVQAYYSVWPVAGALVGFWSAKATAARGAVYDDAPKSRLLRSVIGWVLAAALFALVGWVANLYVRYSLFLLPVVALGSGALLSKLWGRGRSGALLVILVVVFFAFQALALWQQRINYSALCVFE
ncbi:MAG TPA: hypothetical protein VJ183_09440 [Chloroflexia bacterium]|nr:hypothetical protein [Chloroflexia bacterium]